MCYNKFHGGNMKKHGRFAIILFCAAEVSIQLSAQNYYQFTQEDSPHPVTEIQYTGGKSYILVERTDLRRYENGKYIGLTSRETKSYITPEQQNGSTWLYDGSFYVDEATKHNSMEVRGGVNEAVESKFTIDKNGHFTMIVDNGFPSFRSFPSYTNQELFTGAKWVSKSERSVDPLNKGKFTKIPMTVEYTFAGEDVFNEEPVYVINAQWATRYTANNYDPDGDPELKGAQGSHIAKIFISLCKRLRDDYSITKTDEINTKIIEIDKKIEEHSKQTNSPILSIPGISHFSGTSILSELGDINNFSKFCF